MKIGSDYSLFKDNIQPMWEDKANKNGGRWMITLNRNQRPELDRYWIDTVSVEECKEGRKCVRLGSQWKV